jgi:hypothetical protein
MDGLDRSLLMDRYAHTRAGAGMTSDKRAFVQSVHERAARSRQTEKRIGGPAGLAAMRGGLRRCHDASFRAEYVSGRPRVASTAVAPMVAPMTGLR